MPRAKREPRYLLHKPTGQARVLIDGKTHYLGKHDSPESHARYDELIDAWHLRQDPHQQNGRWAKYADVTLDVLVLKFLSWAETYYRDVDGQPTGEVKNMRYAFKPLLKMFGTEPVSEFDSGKLDAYRDRLIKHGYCRKEVNKHVGRVKHLIGWAVEKKLAGRLGGNVFGEVMAVKPLKPNRSDAPERPAVKGVSMARIRATYKKLPKIPRIMLHLQLLTAARPGELVILRPCDIFTDASGWLFRPYKHKNQWRGKDRYIAIGPIGQRLLRPLLEGRHPEAFVFSPAESEALRLATLHANRKTKVQPSQVARARKAKRKKLAVRYSTMSYGRCIRRAAVAAGVGVWSPHRIRHARATELAEAHGIETTAVVLGHADIRSTQVYVEKRPVVATELMRLIG